MSARRRAARLALALSVAAALGLPACDGDGDDATSPPRPTTAPPPPTPPPAPAMTVTAIDTLGGPPLDPASAAQVQAALDRYLTDVLVTPLRTGTPAGDLSPVFTAAALARLAGPDRATLTGEGLPPSPSTVHQEAATAVLVVLGRAGEPAVVAATIDVRLRATGPALDVTVAQQGDLLLVADGPTWKVDGYTVRTARDSNEAPGGGS